MDSASSVRAVAKAVKFSVLLISSKNRGKSNWK